MEPDGASHEARRAPAILATAALGGALEVGGAVGLELDAQGWLHLNRTIRVKGSHPPEYERYAAAWAAQSA